MTTPKHPTNTHCPATVAWQLWRAGLPALLAVSLMEPEGPSEASRPSSWTPR